MLKEHLSQEITLNDTRNGARPNYGGKSSGLHKKVALSNNSEPVANFEILARARATEASFYENQFQVLKNIAAANRPLEKP